MEGWMAQHVEGQMGGQVVGETNKELDQVILEGEKLCQLQPKSGDPGDGWCSINSRWKS